MGSLKLFLVWLGLLVWLSAVFLPSAWAGGAAVAEPFAIGKFLARFHPLLVHMPIGILGFAVVLELYSWFRPSVELRRILLLALALAGLSGVVAAWLGFLLAAEGGYDQATLSWHQWAGVSVALLSILTAVVHWKAFRAGADEKSRAKHLYRGVFACTLIALSAAGHMGGSLTHGSDYLTKYAPPFVKSLLEVAELGGPAKGALQGEGPTHFAEKVLPVLEAKCFRCHGTDKQKGSLRLDKREDAVKGGVSGDPTIVSGDPFKSQLVRRILLPPDDEEVMPPKGKGPFTPEEVMDVIRWIQMGAPFADTPPAEETEESAPVASTTVALPEGKIDFKTHVQPLLEKRCVRCHGAKRRKGKLSLHTLETAKKGGEEGGPAIVPGKPEESAVCMRTGVDPQKDEDEMLMPPEGEGGPLSQEEIELLRRWIAEGAQWPDGLTLQAAKD